MLFRSSKHALFSSSLITLALILFALIGASSAHAQADNFLTGNSQDGTPANINGAAVPNAVAPVVGAVPQGATSLTRGAIRTGSGTGAVTFANSRLVMVYQAGTLTAPTSGDQGVYTLSNSTAGHWEFARISTVSGTTLNFTAPLIYNYASGTAQVIAVPEYAALNVVAGGAISALPWDGTSGGVLAFLVNGALSITGAGTISTNSDGFRGAVSYLQNGASATGCTALDSPTANGTFGMKGEGFFAAAFLNGSPATAGIQQGRGNYANAGGGGGCFNASGGGGGNGGQGGTGGRSLPDYPNNGDGNEPGGLGGSDLTYDVREQAAFGGGGGAGDRNNAGAGNGGIGGGFILVRGGSMTGNGVFTSNGSAGRAGNIDGTPYDGAGGGGAGGSILLRFVGAAACGSVTAAGGAGGNNGTTSGYAWTPGAGGGGGKVNVQRASGTCNATAPAGASGTATGGTNGATAGGAGTTASQSTALANPTLTLAAPANSSTLTTTTTTASGTATAGSTVFVYIDGVYSGTATLVGTNWTYAVPAMGQGSHTIMAYSELAGVDSTPVTNSFTVDSLAPAAPVITVPAAATSYSSSTTPTISGTAEAGSTVRVYDGAGTGTLIGTTTADGSGNWSLSSSALAVGSHTIHATARDAALNVSADSGTKTIVIDTTAPTVSLTTPANGSATNDTTPAIAFTVTETNPGTSRCIVDGGAPFVCTSGSSLPTLTTGSHNLTIQHTDLAGNVGTSATNTFTVDTTAPVAPSVSTPASPFTTNDQTPTFTGLGEPNNTIYIYVDGVLNSVSFTDGSGNWSMDLGTIAAGTHTVYVTSMDAAGNTSPQSAPSRSLTIDLTAPSVSVTTPASNGLTVGPNGNIVFTATDAVGPVTTTCKLDAAAAASCTSPFPYSSLAAGAHTFIVTATDAAGNSAAVTRTFTVDNTAPNTTITANPAAVTNSTTAAFSFTSTKSPSTFECSLDGASPTTCMTGISYSGLSQTSHTFSVRAIDQYGNVDLSPASFTWTVDTTVPVAPTIATPGSDTVTSDTTPTIGGKAEIGSTVRVYDGAGTGTQVGTAVISNASGDWVLSPDPTLAVGVHNLHAVSTDPAGNVSADSLVRVITIDTAAPTVTLTTPNVGTTPANGSTISTTTPVITFTVTDANPSVASLCYVDALPAVTCTSGYSPAALGQGSHQIRVTHTDLAGNVGTSATNTFTVDTIAPNAPVITGGPSAPVASTTAAFTFTGEAGATFQCYIDTPATWVACTSGVSYPGLAQGAHTFHVRQTDAGGNVSSESTRSWSVDTVGPPAPSVSGPTGTVGSTSATINLNDTESPVTYMCSLDGAAATSCSDPVSLTGLSNGPHSFAVFARDTLLNNGATTTINWTVDTSLFTAGITAGPLGTVGTNNNSLSFTATITSGTTFMCKVDSGSYASCTSPFSTGVLADGLHTFSVYAVNGSQNSAAVSRTWTIDTVGPAITITSPTNLQTVAPNGNVVFSATDTTGPITYTCKIDAATAVSCGSPFVFTNLTTGAHSVTIVATDAVSNSSTLVRNFNVDATPPNTSITANPAAVTNSTSAAFSFTSTESPSTFECSLDGATATTCTTGISYSSLSQASHTFSVRAIDQYGNVDQTPATYTWTVDTTAPVAPSINTPASDTVTTDTTPAIAGLAEANSTVNVYQGATLIGTATADGSGIWSLSPDPTFSQGPHALVARATDAAGNTSVNSATRTITIDTTPPVVTITSPLTGAVTGDNTPNIVFTATDTNLSTVQCSVDAGTPVTCTSPWTTPTLIDGLHTISVIATDASNQQTVASVTFTVDTAAPAAPSITTPASDISTTTRRPVISGTAEPNSSIKVYDGATQIGTASTNGSGDWSFTPTSDLSEAAHAIHVTATDAAGNTSVNSNTRTITVDLTAPSAPVITSPAGNVTTSSVRPPLGGTAEAYSTVTVYDGATSIGTTTTNGAGDWSFTPSSDLSEGAHAFHATATDEAGNTGVASNVRTITIDLTAPDAPAITTPSANLTTAVNTQAIGGTAEANSTVTVYDGATLLGTATADGSGAWSLSPDPTFTEAIHILVAYSTDAAGNTSPASPSRTITIDNTAPDKPAITSPTQGQTTGDTTPSVSGVAEPGADVDVYDGATLICSATANISGDWSCTPGTPLSDGDHTLTAKATDPSGNESNSSDGVDLIIDTTAPSVSITSPGNGLTVSVSSPALVFTATDDNPDLVECKVDNSNFVVCSSGDLMTGLLDGSHTASVRATDKAGNVATASTTFTVDTTAPTTTIGTKPNARDNDTTPTFAFTANDGGATFECRILPDAFAPCTSPFTSSTVLTDGSHTFEVRATDTHGNTEGPAKSYTWTVDATPPAKPVVTAPVSGITTNDSTPTISGTAEANSSVQVFVDGNSIGTVTANGSGVWTINAPTLTDGPHNATARATDTANNVGALSDPAPFTVDTMPPDGSVSEVPGSGGPGKNPTFNIATPDGTATIACSLDGAPSAPCSAPFTPTGTLTVGTHNLVVTFTDPTGNVTTRTITFVIAGVAVTPPVETADPTQCLGGGVVITNLFPKGGKATVSGFARKDLVGKTVTITYNATKKAVATAVVTADGSFATTFKAPPKKDWNKNTTTYLASAGSFKSKKTKLVRRTSSTVVTYSAGKLTVTGSVTLPLVKGGGATIKAKTGCTGTWKPIGTTKFKSNGGFSFTAPYAGSGVIFVQVNAVIGNPSVKNKKFKTNSFVVPVIVK